MLRRIIRALAIAVGILIVLVVLDFAEILVPAGPDDSASMAATVPGCSGRVLAEGITYHIRDPRQNDVVLVHAAVTDQGKVVPDKDATDRILVLRIAAGPGDVIEGRDGTVFVNDIKLDDITTKPFPKQTVPNEQFFLLGDNRSAAIDSRAFGPVLRNAIYAKVFAVDWPLRDITFRLHRSSGAPPGHIACD